MHVPPVAHLPEGEYLVRMAEMRPQKVLQQEAIKQWYGRPRRKATAVSSLRGGRAEAKLTCGATADSAGQKARTKASGHEAFHASADVRHNW